MTAETSKLLMQKQAGHKKTWGMEWREKAAAYVDYLAAFLAPWQKLFWRNIESTQHWLFMPLECNLTKLHGKNNLDFF